MGKKKNKQAAPVAADRPSFVAGDDDDDPVEQPSTSTNGSAKVNFQLNEMKKKAPSALSNGKLRHSPSEATLNRLDRIDIVIYKQPLLTAWYCLMEIVCKSGEALVWIYERKFTLIWPLLFVIALFGLYHTEGPHQSAVGHLEQNIVLCWYWMFLGVLSSIGLGTGLHTFLLYLGPHIAKVTLAAYECNSLAFPEPPYPDEIVCPEADTSGVLVTLWAIMSKVRLEAFMWGAGTALGELPPYFMARAARLSGEESDNPEYQEFLQFMAERDKAPNSNDEPMSFWQRVKLRGEKSIEQIVEKVGFLGILLCASVPNPLFDLAGITCGHFLVPFWTFFTATLIGKAIIKMHIQKLFVILAFSEHYVEKYVALLGDVPKIGPVLQEPFKEFLSKQKQALHSRTPHAKESLLGKVFNYFVFAMVAYFVLSLVNSLAQAYHARLWEREKERKQNKRK